MRPNCLFPNNVPLFSEPTLGDFSPITLFPLAKKIYLPNMSGSDRGEMWSGRAKNEKPKVKNKNQKRLKWKRCHSCPRLHPRKKRRVDARWAQSVRITILILHLVENAQVVNPQILQRNNDYIKKKNQTKTKKPQNKPGSRSASKSEKSIQRKLRGRNQRARKASPPALDNVAQRPT